MNGEDIFFKIYLLRTTIVPMDRRIFWRGPKKIIDDQFVQDLKTAKRISKDLFFDSLALFIITSVISYIAKLFLF